MVSTDTSNTNDYRFNSHVDAIELYMAKDMKKSIIQSSSNIPFRNVDYLAIYSSLMDLPIISFLKNIFVSSK